MGDPTHHLESITSAGHNGIFQEYKIHGPGCIQSEFNVLYQYKKPTKNGFKQNLHQRYLKCHCVTALHQLFPITKWLPKYKWREDFTNDLVSGITVAIMHIPQGMAYALLGGVAPVIGIYMAFFPVLLYILMGTSRHISMGTFAVVCMMVSKSVMLYSDPIYSPDGSVSNISYYNNSIQNVSQNANPTISYTPLQVAIAVCFTVGIWQVLLGVLRLGVLSVLLSETLVSGFTTGAAIHVATSQAKNLLGIQIGRYNGPLKIIYTFIDLFANIHKANVMAVGISLATIVILVIYNEFIKPIVNRKLPIPLPIELIAVITGTLISMVSGLQENFAITVVGDIPTGLPNPAVPPFELIPHLLVDGFVIAIVAFSVNMSMASIFSRKLNYEIDANQELIASGCSNLFGSFFSCMPFAASLSRSMIQQTVGGKTQLASVVSCTLLLFVLLLIGPFFEPLPNCILASIVVVALKSMFLQVTQLPSIWRHSQLDGLVWLTTFLSVILLDIDIGLGIGIVLSLLTIVILGHRPVISQLGHVPKTDIYLDMTRYQTATETPGICILKLAGGLHFANCEHTLHRLYEVLNKVINESMIKCEDSIQSDTLNAFDVCPEKTNEDDANTDHETETLVLNTLSKSSIPIFCVVLDMNAVSFVDPSAMKSLLYMYEDLTKKGIIFYMAGCSATVYENFLGCKFLLEFPECNLFASVSDAIFFVQQATRSAVTS